MYLAQVVRTKEIPFGLFTADNLPEKTIKALMREAKYALKHGKRYASAKEMHDDILRNG